MGYVIKYNNGPHQNFCYWCLKCDLEIGNVFSVKDPEYQKLIKHHHEIHKDF